MAVRCKLPGVPGIEMALLDTGAQWSMIGGELARILLGSIEITNDKPPAMQTRKGRMQGKMGRLTITLVAEEGRHLDVDATVMLSEDWPGPVVLGYRGLLERARLALDPGIGSADRWLFFGAPAGV